MIKFQRIIKYFALGLAVLLIVNIISLTMYGIISLGQVFTTNNDEDITENLKNVEIKTDIKNLSIDTISLNITIKKGTTFKVETNNKYIKINENNQKLSITEEKHNWLNKNNTGKLIIYVPDNYIFDNVSLENGAGKINIEILSTQKLNLDLGAGKVTIDNLTVLTESEIDGGAGEITIKEGSLNNLDLDMGVGKVTINSFISGSSEIDAGIGELNLNLSGTEDDYKIILDKGIGNATINEQLMQDSKYYGNGSNLINISGGIGAININFSR